MNSFIQNILKIIFSDEKFVKIIRTKFSTTCVSFLKKALDAIDFCGGHGCNSKISQVNRPRTMAEVRSKLDEKAQ